MLHIHEDSGPHLAQGTRAISRAPLNGKVAQPAARAPGKEVAPVKPRRALGDITNKNGKQGAQPAAAGPVVKEALKPRVPHAPPADFDEIERMFPAPPPHISLDLSGIDLDAVVDSVLQYDRRSAGALAPAGADVADALDALLIEDELPLAPEPALFDLSAALAPADEGSGSALASELPESVEVDESGVMSNSEDEEMELE